MVQRDVELVREAITRWGDREHMDEGFRRYLHPDVEYVEDPAWPGAGHFRGIDEVRNRWYEYAELLGEAATLTPEELGAVGDAVLVVAVSRGIAAGSGLRYEHRWGYVFRLRDGKIVLWEAYLDPENARRSAARDR